MADTEYLTPDEQRERAERAREAEGAPGPDRSDFEERGYRDLYPNAVQDPRSMSAPGSPAFTSGGSSSGSSGSAYLTPDEARERGVAWVARPGEPSDLRDPYHYQTQDESTALGRDWATQNAIKSGNARHAGFTPEMSPEQIRALGRTTPDEINAWFASGGNASGVNPAFLGGSRGSRPPFENTSPLFDDPASRLLEDYALDRFGQRQNPDPNSGTAIFEKYARELIDTLKGPVYSAQDEALLKGKALDAISREEAATQQQWLEEISRRRLSPSSGPALEGLQRIKEHFNQARQSFETTFARDAIAATRAQRVQVLDTAGQLAGSEEARLREAGTYAAIPKQLQDNSFQQGLQLVGAGGSPQSVLNSALALQQAGQQQDYYQSQQRQQLTSGLMQLIGYMFG